MKTIGITSVALMYLVAAPLAVAADEQSASLIDNVLTISVTGEAIGKPDTMHVKFIAKSTAERAADALKQCKSKSDAATMAINQLKIKSLVIQRDMFHFSIPGADNPYQALQTTTPPTGTTVSQTINITISSIGKISNDKIAATVASLFDAAKSAGVSQAQPSSLQAQITGQDAPKAVHFSLTDATAVKGEAIRDALEKAKSIKNKFQESGLNVGELVAVKFNQQDMVASSNIWGQILSQQQNKKSARATSESPDGVTLDRSLTVSYDINKR